MASVKDDMAAVMRMNEFEAGLLQSAMFVGVILGTSLGGILSDRHGRRSAVLVAYSLLVLAGAGFVLAPEYWCMAAACVLFGIGGGVSIPSQSALLVESSPSANRGDLICLSALDFYSGEMYGAGCVWFLTEAPFRLPGAPATGLHWRACFLIGILPLLAIFLWAAARLNESPRYLASQGRNREAARCVENIATVNGVSAPPVVSGGDSEAGSLESTDDRVVDRASWRRVGRALSRWPMSGAVAGLMWLCVIVNFCFYGLMLNLPQILERNSAGDYGGPAAQVFAASFFSLLGLTLAVYLIRREDIGHRTSLAILFSGGALSASAYPALQAWGMRLPALLAACMLKLFASAAFQLLYVFAIETFPTQLRSRGMALITMVGRIGSISAPPVYGLFVTYASISGFFYLLAALELANVGTALLIPRDTKGMSLGELSREVSFGTMSTYTI